jgi:di/tripeptidase
MPRETPYCEAYEIDLSHPFLNELERTLFARDGVSPVYNPSVADECIFAHRLGMPVLSLGPIGSGDHTADEWVDIVSLRKTTQVFGEIAEAYAQKFLINKSAANSGGY